MSPGMETSYYGASCFALPDGKECRGNVVIYRLMLTKPILEAGVNPD